MRTVQPEVPSFRYFQGEMLLLGDSGYEQARQIFNERVRGRPAVIARCAGVADVRAALGLAWERGLEVSVRGGGHGVAGWSSNDGGLVIDLSPMRWVRIDPATSTAWVGGGTLAGDLIVEASQFGLAPVTGVVPQIGIAGLVMGVGEGYLSPKYGFGADNVLAFDLVTADGSVLRVSSDEHPELFWALRGAGANFGVVTALKLRLHPAPQQAVGGYLTFDSHNVQQVTRHVWEIMETGSEYFYPEVHYGLDDAGTLNVRVFPGHTGPVDVAEREIGALRRCATPISDEIRTMSYVELAHDRTDTFGDPRPRRCIWDLYRLEFGASPDRQIEVLLEQANALPPSTALILWRTVPKETTITPPSVVPRLPGISLCLLAGWERAAEDEERLRWLEKATAPFRHASLVTEAANAMNHVSILDHGRVKRLYGDGAYQRLAKLKCKYDPENRFHRNYNIPPA